MVGVSAFLQAPPPDLVADLVRFAMMAWPRMREHQVGTVALLGSVPGEGTSTLTCLLGQVLAAHQDLRVLLCDANRRAPALATLAGVDGERGWLDAGSPDLEACCEPSPWPGVAVCPPGRGAPAGGNGATAALRPVLERAAAAFDVVLLDCPPLEFMGASLQMARLADATILVVEAERLSREALLHSCATLRSLDQPFLGAALNRHRRPIPEGLYRRL